MLSYLQRLFVPGDDQSPWSQAAQPEAGTSPQQQADIQQFRHDLTSTEDWLTSLFTVRKTFAVWGEGQSVGVLSSTVDQQIWDKCARGPEVQISSL